MNQELKTFTKSALEKEIKLLEKKSIKLGDQIKNAKEILEDNKKEKKDIELKIEQFTNLKQNLF